MHSGLSDVLASRPVDDGRLRTLISWSLVIHVAGLGLLAVLPTSWLGQTPPMEDVMVISLAGVEGPSTTGTAPIAGKQVDVLKEDKRPEPPKPPATTKPDVIPPPQAKPTQPKPTPPPQKPTTAPPAAVTKPPVAGARVQEGTAKADTGATGVNQGLTVAGGSGGGDAVDLNNFYPEWVAKFKDAINRVWNRNQPETGYVVLRFTIRRNGSVVETVPAALEGSGQYLLNSAAQRAVLDARFPPLPDEYTGNELIIRLRFDYDRR